MGTSARTPSGEKWPKALKPDGDVCVGTPSRVKRLRALKPDGVVCWESRLKAFGLMGWVRWG